MKSDLDRIMKENEIDVLLITGAALHNSAMVYFTGTCHVSSAILVKKRGSEAVLCHFAMERDEALLSGLQTINFNKYPIEELIKEAKNDITDAVVLRYRRIFADLGVTAGRVAVYGQNDTGASYAILTRLQKALPDLEFVGFLEDEVLLNARMTKDTKEIEHIRQMGRLTVDVVGRTADFLTGHKVKGDMLVHSDGTPVTIGEVKNNINLWLAEKNAENPESTIFAIGRDAGVPHSVGTPSDPLRLGQTIIYDIYPCEGLGGYFYDFTRTWCLGHATDEQYKLYEDVRSVYNQLYAELKVNAPFGDYQKRTCELFEAQGHPTPLHTPTTEIGYCHSLGHGVGLDVHEKPFSNMLNPSPTDNLVPGTVFTLEPGLYYPDKSMGARIEDTIWTTPEGKFEIMVDFPKDLVLPMKG